MQGNNHLTVVSPPLPPTPKCHPYVMRNFHNLINFSKIRDKPKSLENIQLLGPAGFESSKYFCKQSTWHLHQFTFADLSWFTDFVNIWSHHLPNIVFPCMVRQNMLCVSTLLFLLLCRLVYFIQTLCHTKYFDGVFFLSINIPSQFQYHIFQCSNYR